jgi:hypothetical protein
VKEEAMNTRMTTRRFAFSMVEVLIVLGLLALLFAFLVPVVQRVRSAAARTQSMNNLRQLGIGCHAFHDVSKRLPFNGEKGSLADFRVRDSGSWAYQILPFMEQEPAFKTPERSRDLFFPVYLCPQRGRLGATTEGKFKGAVTDYAINCWLNEWKDGSLAAPNRGMKIHTIPDGSSNTVLLGQLALRTTDYQAREATEGLETFFIGGMAGSGRNGFKHMQDAPDIAAVPNFGSPISSGTLFCMGDVVVRQISFSFSMETGLRPNDEKPAPGDR